VTGSLCRYDICVRQTAERCASANGQKRSDITYQDLLHNSCPGVVRLNDLKLSVLRIYRSLEASYLNVWVRFLYTSFEVLASSKATNKEDALKIAVSMEM
jgi:hypothetical protein